MWEVGVDLAVVAALLVLGAVGFLYSWRIPKREGFEQDRYGPTRGFAKLKVSFENMGMPKPLAVSMTECVSGALHAPYGFILGYFLTEQIAHARWAAALVLVFWIGFGAGRANIVEKRIRYNRKR